MTPYDDIQQRPRSGLSPEGIGYNTRYDPLQRSERHHPREKFFGDRSDEQEESIRNTGDAVWRQVFATWLLAALLVMVLLAVLTPNVPRPNHAVTTPTASTAHSGDAARTPTTKGYDPIPCSDLDYAYEKC